MISGRAEARYCNWSGDTMGYTHALRIYATDGRMYMIPDSETDETFIDRIRRSKEAGRNLFYEEFEEFNPHELLLW